MMARPREKDDPKAIQRRMHGSIQVDPYHESELIRRTVPQRRPSRQSSSFLRREPRIELEQLPQLISSPDRDRETLFKKKMDQCCIVFDFSDPLKDINSKEIKRATLNELINYVTTAASLLNDTTWPLAIRLVKANCFRDLPPHSDGADPEDEDYAVEASWPHLNLVYELFIRLLDRPDMDHKRAKQYVTHEFLVNVLRLLDSEDRRERDLVKTMLHKLYAKFIQHRSFIRKEVKHLLLRFIYEEYCFFGTSDILDIYASIINGLAVPLKQEHRDFLVKVLMPLHKVDGSRLKSFHPNLTYCIVLFVEKDPALAPEIVTSLLRCWPKTNSSKEVGILAELEEILDAIEPEYFMTLAPQIFKRIAECIKSPCAQICQRALFIFNNEYIVGIIDSSAETIMPIMFPALYEMSMSHWHRESVQMCVATLHQFKQMDKKLFDELTEKYRPEIERKQQKKAERDLFWEEVQKRADERTTQSSAVTGSAVANGHHKADNNDDEPPANGSGVTATAAVKKSSAKYRVGSERSNESPKTSLDEQSKH